LIGARASARRHRTFVSVRAPTIVQWIRLHAFDVIDDIASERETMNNLAQSAIDAHGGLDRWRRFEHVSAHLRTGGVLWALKRQQGILGDVNVRVALHREWASHAPFRESGLRTSFEPHRVAIETTEGRVVEERLQPRDSFSGHGLETPWDPLHLAYFAGYAMWTYLTVPFVFASDGVSTEELEPWYEDGESWRRLQVTFPARIATHNTVQTFYFGLDGLLRRHDYAAEVLAGAPAAHYVHDYREFSGLAVPLRRRVFLRQPDGTPAPDPSIVTIDLSEVEFT
jgi:hypothetical protein